MFDPEKAKLTPDQLELAEVVYTLQQMVRAELDDEDPGVIDWDDIVTIALQVPVLIPKINRLIAIITQTGDGFGLAALLSGAGAATVNHIFAELHESAPEEPSDQI